MHISTTITQISGGPWNYTLHSSITKFGPFNDVIFATPAPISSSLLSTLPTPNSDLCKALNTFKYVPPLVITHTDPSFVPTSPSLQRDLHFQRPSTPIPSLQILQGT